MICTYSSEPVKKTNPLEYAQGRDFSGCVQATFPEVTEFPCYYARDQH